MTQLKRSLGSKRALKGLVILMIFAFLGSAVIFAADKDNEKNSEKGKSGKAFLGAVLQNLSEEDQDGNQSLFGVEVVKITKGEAAEKAGLKAGDIIQYFNGEKVEEPGQLVEAITKSHPGSKVAVKVLRDGKTMQMDVTLGSRKEVALEVFKAGDLDELKKFGKEFNFGGGYLGVNLNQISKELADYFGVNEKEGALILSVEEKSPAQKAGLKAGDVITQINSKKITGPDDVVKMISKLDKGAAVEIQVVRHQKKMTVKAELEKRMGFSNFQKDFNIAIPDLPNLPEHMAKVYKFKDLDGDEECYEFNMPQLDKEKQIIIEKKFKKAQEKMAQANEKMARAHEKMERSCEKMAQMDGDKAMVIERCLKKAEEALKCAQETIKRVHGENCKGSKCIVIRSGKGDCGNCKQKCDKEGVAAPEKIEKHVKVIIKDKKDDEKEDEKD